MFKCFFTLHKMHQYTIASYLCWCYMKCKIITFRNISFVNEAVVLHPLHKFFVFFFRYGNHQGLLRVVGSRGDGGCSSAAGGSMVGINIAARWSQSPGDSLVHQIVHGLEAHGALDETVNAQLVVQHPAGALAGGDAGEDQHGLAGILPHQIKELPSLLFVQIHLEGHSVLRIVEHFQQTPSPDGGWRSNLCLCYMKYKIIAAGPSLPLTKPLTSKNRTHSLKIIVDAYHTCKKYTCMMCIHTYILYCTFNLT